MTKPGAAHRHCPGPRLPHAHALPPNPATFMFRSRLWSRLNYKLCAEGSREGAASQHPHPQHPGYARPGPLVPLPPGPASPARLSRVRCPPGMVALCPWGLRQPGAASCPGTSTFLGVLRAPWTHVGAMVKLCTRHRHWRRLSGLTPLAGGNALGVTVSPGGPPALHPLGGEVSDLLVWPQAPSSLLPASTEPPPGCSIPAPGSLSALGC